MSWMAQSQALAQPSAGRVRPPATACAGTGDVLAAVGEPSMFTWSCPCERGRWATVPGRGLPCYLRRQPPPLRENALFRQLPDSSRAPAARECVAKAMGTILLILLAIVLLPAPRCPGRERRGQLDWDEGCLRGGEGAPHDPPSQP